jgi:hypothetical protein
MRGQGASHHAIVMYEYEDADCPGWCGRFDQNQPASAQIRAAGWAAGVIYACVRLWTPRAPVQVTLGGRGELLYSPLA